jgi:hypothetical protein
MSSEGVGVKCEVKYAKLVKWENHPITGLPMKDRPPLEVMEKFGDDQPFRVTFQRGNSNAPA